MSYILESPDAIINIKLTNYGRKQLASGKLTYNYYAFGDSEVDYNFGQANSLNVKHDISDNRIIAPKDDYDTIKNILVPNLIGGSYTTLLDSITGNTLTKLTPQEVVAENEAENRGFFTGDTSSGFEFKVNEDFLRNWGTTTQASLDGTTQIDVSFSGASDNIQTGDYVLVAFRSPSLSGSSESLGDVPLNTSLQYLVYYVEGLNISYPNKTLILDRNLPDFSGSGSEDVNVYVFPGGDSINEFYGSGSTSNYWTPGTLNFEEPCLKSVDDVGVINMNIVQFDNMIGTQPSVGQAQYTEYGSSDFNGIKELLDYNQTKVHNTDPYAVGIIHYTNHSVSNYYGEYFTGTLYVDLPTIMYHRKDNTNIGVTLSADMSNDNNRIDTNSGFDYFELVDDTSDANVVGKVFPELKMVFIEDQELLAAMSYKSNRNYTLPEANVNTYSFGTPTLLDPNERLWVTYMFGNSSGYTAGKTMGFGNSLPCQYIQKIDHPNSTTSSLDVSLSIPSTDLPFFKDPDEVDSSDGGFNAQKMYILAQKTANTVQKPLASQWKVIDVTTKLGGSISGVTKASLNASPPNVVITDSDYTSASAFNINNFGFEIPQTGVDGLNFGDEVFLLGNLRTNIAAKIYRTKFVCHAPIGKFNNSPNNNTQNGNKTYISEVGVYDSNKKMVAIGKLGQPILKQDSVDLNTDKDITVELLLDF